MHPHHREPEINLPESLPQRERSPPHKPQSSCENTDQSLKNNLNFPEFHAQLKFQSPHSQLHTRSSKRSSPPPALMRAHNPQAGGVLIVVLIKSIYQPWDCKVGDSGKLPAMHPHSLSSHAQIWRKRNQNKRGNTWPRLTGEVEEM